MKLTLNIAIAVCLVSLFSVSVPAQKAAKQPAKKPIIFAVLNDGKTLEPIAHVNKGKLEAPVNGSDDVKAITAFNKSYYKPGASYRLIFGGANAGTVTIKSSNANAECSRNMATVTTKALKTPLAGLVMGVATDAPGKAGTTTYRRRPTAAERGEIEELVNAEFKRQKLTPTVLRYQNLTALDLDNDGKAEFVGSYWVEVDKQTRALLFFIAGRGTNGKLNFGHQEYRTVDQASVMSGEISAVDEGIYHELLLDVFDVNGDGKAEVFTYTRSFEGAGFNVFQASGAKWTRLFDGSNYHCAF
ncbi:MAG: hypothetical protein AB7J13_08820 [Pyrinomonadaceae bacterium]